MFWLRTSTQASPRRRNLRAFLAVVLTIGTLTQFLSANGLSWAADKRADTTVDRAIVVVNGRERVVAIGDIVAQGQPTDTVGDARGRSDASGDEGTVAECEIPKTKYGLEGNGAGTAAIRLKITDDCQLVVDSIDVGVPLPDHLSSLEELDQAQNGGEVDAAARRKRVKRQTGGWNTHHDIFGLLLTESYAHIKYKDDGKRVSNAKGQLTYCYNARDGWHGTGSLGDWSETRRTIWIWKRCSFSYVNGSFKHELDVDVYSWPGNDWAVYCTERGIFVPRGYLDCGKAHKRL